MRRRTSREKFCEVRLDRRTAQGVVVLDVSVRGYRAWKGGGKPERKRLTDAQMLILIQSIHAEFGGDLRQTAYGQEIACRADSRQSNAPSAISCIAASPTAHDCGLSSLCAQQSRLGERSF